MMNQQDIFRKIGNILTELNEQYHFLAQNPEKLNALELELFFANADFLSDHAKILKKLNSSYNEENPGETDAGLLLKEQNATTLSETDYKNEEKVPEPAVIDSILTAEEEEERVDVIPQQEQVENEIIHEKTAESILEKDFFKPDNNSNTFEFVMDSHAGAGKFDYEEKSVNKIFDRPLSKEEEAILLQKKNIHEKEQAAERGAPAVYEDEIGPEPFLMSHENAINHTEADERIELHKSATEEALKDADFNKDSIAPAAEAPEVFTPDSIPVHPPVQSIHPKPAPSINDLLAKTNAQPAEVIKAPISDLKQSINLNEKLLFIKDLFGGYNMAYSEALDIINKMPDFDTADSFLQKNYAVKNNWAAKQQTVDQFYELLNRRFS